MLQAPICLAKSILGGALAHSHLHVLWLRSRYPRLLKAHSSHIVLVLRVGPFDSDG